MNAQHSIVKENSVSANYLETQKLAQTRAHHHMLAAENTAEAVIRMENSFQVPKPAAQGGSWWPAIPWSSGATEEFCLCNSRQKSVFLLMRRDSLWLEGYFLLLLKKPS